MARILVVDDAPFMRRILAGALMAEGHTIVGEAEDGKEAVEKYQLLKPDVVTMDITMPNLNGIEAIRKIIAFDPLAKIIICSTINDTSNIKAALQAGAKDFIMKPFTSAGVSDAISRLMN